MSYELAKAELGKAPLVAVGIVADTCSLTAGVAPCTATETGNAKCYNGRISCNDVPNYDLTTTEIKFCEARSNLPEGENIIPAISGKIKKAPTSTTAGKGLGRRAVVKVKLKDFPHHDRGIDPYFAERTYNAEETGTFWGKWLRRNPYYEGRTLKVYYGYIQDPFSWDDFEVQEYDISDIDGPTRGYVNITAKDILVRTYEAKAQYPVLSEGTLLNDIIDGAATGTLTPTGIGDSDYPASGTCSIGGEAKTFTRVADVLTFTAHAQWGTTPDAHDAEDVVQICKTWTRENVLDVLYELLVTGAGIPTSYIPYANGSGPDESWDDEKREWMDTALATGILLEPRGVEAVINEISEQFMFDIWWDSVSQEIRVKSLSPEVLGVTVPTLGDDYQILEDTLKIKREEKLRYTEVQVWYDKIDFSEKDETTNYRAARISADASRAGPTRYDGNSIKVIKANWIGDLAQASQLSGRLLARFSDTPEIITFEVAPKDSTDVNLAERIEMDSWQMQDLSGANESRKFQVTQILEKDPGHSFQITAQTSSFSGRYWRIAPNSTPTYSNATEDERDKWGFICYNTGVFLDGEPAYKFI